MINFIKKLLRLRTETKNTKMMKKEYDVLMYFVKHSDSLQDFVFCKKKIRKFDYKWNTDDMSQFKPNTYYRKLSREYNYQLRERSHRWSKEK